MSTKISGKWNLLLEDILNGAYHSLHRFRHHDLELLGSFAFVFIPLLDMLNAYLYYQKMQSLKGNDPSDKSLRYRRFMLALHVMKALITTTAVTLLIVGVAATVGLMAIFAVNAVYALRSLGRSIFYAFKGDKKTAAKHFTNFLVSGAFAAAFALILVFPQVTVPAFLAWGLAIGGTVVGLSSKLVSWWSGKYQVRAQVKPVAVAPAPSKPQVDINQLTQQANNSIDAALVIQDQFKTTHPMSLENYLQDHQLENDFDNIICEFINKVLPTIENKSQSPYYSDSIKNWVADPKANFKELFQYYKNRMIHKPITEIIEDSYAFDRKSSGEECTRNTMADDFYKNHLAASSYSSYRDLQAAIVVTHATINRTKTNELFATSLPATIEELEKATAQLDKISHPTTHLDLHSQAATGLTSSHAPKNSVDFKLVLHEHTSEHTVI